MDTSTYPQPSLRVHPRPGTALAVLLPFVLLFWVNIAHHTLWFDEVNAWAISAASPTLSRLFYYVHYEGHPWLWYFILWFPSRFTHDPVALKWVEAVFGTAILAVLGLLSPFTLKQRALLLSGYFLVWEYTVMCRMYSVMLLCVLLYAAYRVRKPHGVLGCCILLGLAASTDMSGMLLASALLIEFAFSSWFITPSPSANLPSRPERSLRPWIIALAVYAAFIALAVATLWPSKDISWQTSGHLGSLALNPAHILSSFGNMTATPWWPISAQFPHRFWSSSVTYTHKLYALVPLVLFVYWITFRRQRNLLLLMACTLAFGTLFADVVYDGRPRHWGIAVVSFIIGLWLQAADARQQPRPSRWSPWTYALLAISTAAGICAIVGSWLHPFSSAREAAAWIRTTQPANAPITGLPDVGFGSLAGELQRPVWFLECQCQDTFKLFSKERDQFPDSDIPTRLDTALNRLGQREILFTFSHPLPPDTVQGLASQGLSAELLKSFPSAEMKTESFYIYRIRRSSP